MADIFSRGKRRLDGLNRYAYCGNNPVVYVDPSGHVYVPANLEETGATEEQIQAYESYIGHNYYTGSGEISVTLESTNPQYPPAYDSNYEDEFYNWMDSNGFDDYGDGDLQFAYYEQWQQIRPHGGPPSDPREYHPGPTPTPAPTQTPVFTSKPTPSPTPNPIKFVPQDPRDIKDIPPHDYEKVKKWACFWMAYDLFLLLGRNPGKWNYLKWVNGFENYTRTTKPLAKTYGYLFFFYNGKKGPSHTLAYEYDGGAKYKYWMTDGNKKDWVLNNNDIESLTINAVAFDFFNYHYFVPVGELK